MYVPQYPKKIIEKAANQWLKNNPELRRSIVNLGAIAINTDANVRDLKILLDNKLGTIFHRSHFDEWMNGYNCCEVDPVIEYEDSCIAYMSKYYDFDLKPYVKEIHQFLFFTPLLNKRNPQCWRFLSNYYLAKGGIDATDNLYTPASVFNDLVRHLMDEGLSQNDIVAYILFALTGNDGNAEIMEAARHGIIGLLPRGVNSNETIASPELCWNYLRGITRNPMISRTINTFRISPAAFFNTEIRDDIMDIIPNGENINLEKLKAAFGLYFGRIERDNEEHVEPYNLNASVRPIVLDGLAVFMDYPNWKTFCEENPDEKSSFSDSCGIEQFINPLANGQLITISLLYKNNRASSLRLVLKTIDKDDYAFTVHFISEELAEQLPKGTDIVLDSITLGEPFICHIRENDAKVELNCCTVDDINPTDPYANVGYETDGNYLKELMILVQAKLQEVTNDDERFRIIDANTSAYALSNVFREHRADISRNTIDRFLKHLYAQGNIKPNIALLDNLSIFLGYTSYMDFVYTHIHHRSPFPLYLPEDFSVDEELHICYGYNPEHILHCVVTESEGAKVFRVISAAGSSLLHKDDTFTFHHLRIGEDVVLNVLTHDGMSMHELYNSNQSLQSVTKDC